MTGTTTHEHAPFPVHWDDPSDASFTWRGDRMHFPRPVSLLTQSVGSLIFVAGLSKAAQEFSMPIRAVHIRFQNGYEFDRFDLVKPANDEEAQAIGARAETAMRAAVAGQMERWTNEYLPHLLTNHERLNVIIGEVATSPDLAGLIDEAIGIGKDDFYVHFLVVSPMSLAMQLFDELYADLFGGDAADAHALLIGQSSKSVAAGIALSELAKFARRAGLKEQILALAPERVLDELSQAESEAGRELAAKIRAFLDEFGLRQDVFDFATPTWREDPSIAIASIHAYLISGHDMAESHEAAKKRADDAFFAARARLVSFPGPVRAQFEAMVQAGRAANFLQEEHNFYIDQQSIALLRLFFQQVGARFVAEDKLDQPDDIFMLTLDEVADMIDGRGNARALISDRWATLAQQMHLVSPPFIGTPRSGPTHADNPMTRATMRFFGGPPQQADAPNQLKGNAGSRGTVRGIARVAQSLDDAKHLQPGEILVAVTTMPAWTPLFGVAGAVVTETGGPLSHCAIVAREYGIPAVVGAFGATSAIQSGQTIVVDGNRGVVTLE